MTNKSQRAVVKKAADKAEAGKVPANKSKAAKSDETHPGNARVPKSVLMGKFPLDERNDAPPVEVAKDNKPMVILDNRNKGLVKVSLIEGVGLTEDTDGRLLFVESNVIHDIMSLEVAKQHFGIMKDGTLIYEQQHFQVGQVGDDFELIDIVALIEHNNSSAGVSKDKALKADVDKVTGEKDAAEKKAAADKAKTDKASTRDDGK